MPDDTLTEPWRSFLQDLDALIDGPTELHCLGGFVIAELYDFERVTADVDVIVVLRERYRSELRWQLGRPEREDTTLDLWLEMIAEITAPQNEPNTPAESR